MSPDADWRTVSRARRGEYRGSARTRVVHVGPVAVGGSRPVVIAGPCAVESAAQTLAVARAVRAAGADMLRGGAFKPRTSPYAFQGLGVEGLEILADARAETGLPIVTEVLDVRRLALVERYADVLQIGSRNMQNFPLLDEVGRTRKPVLLKRGMAATLGEWLAAAEYVARGGNEDILLCERGVRGLGNGEYDRNTLDLNVIPALLERTHLPVIVDPSHGTGVATMVARASLGAVAFGAHGLILEVLPEGVPTTAPFCDAHQSIWPSTLARIVEALPAAAAFARREAEHAMEEVAAVSDPPTLTREERGGDPEGEGHRCSA